MSIPSNGWLPSKSEASPAFKSAAPNAYGEDTQIQSDKAEETSFTDFLFGEDGMDVYDLLDVVNPLQHIPLVNTAYRELTGDEIGQGAQMAGGALYGGLFGLAGSAANAVVEAATGRDISEHAMALFEGDEADPADTPLMASWFADDTPADPASAVAATEPEVAVAAAEPLNEKDLLLKDLGLDQAAALTNNEPEPEAQPDFTQPRDIPVADGMSHFSAFAANGQLMSPAELAAQLNQQRVDQRQQAIADADDEDPVEAESQALLFGDDEAQTPFDAPEEQADAAVAQDQTAPVAPQPVADVAASSSAVSSPAVSPAGSPASAVHTVSAVQSNGAPQLGNWFDGAMMEALQKYQAMKADQI